MKFIFISLLSLSAFGASDFEVCTTNHTREGNQMHCTSERNLHKAKKELRLRGFRTRKAQASRVK